jgi:transcriptional regulator with XRE-family HTH domain
MNEKRGAGRPPITYKRSEASVALRARREALGLSTYQAAGLLGVSQPSIVQAETGRWHISAAKAAERLAAYDALALVNEKPAAGGEGLPVSPIPPAGRPPHQRPGIR